MKSTALSGVPVAVPSQFLVQGPLAAFESATARNVSAVKIVGSEVRKHWSILCEKLMNTPVLSYTLNCLRRTMATTSTGNAAKTVR